MCLLRCHPSVDPMPSHGGMPASAHRGGNEPIEPEFELWVSNTSIRRWLLSFFVTCTLRIYAAVQHCHCSNEAAPGLRRVRDCGREGIAAAKELPRIAGMIRVSDYCRHTICHRHRWASKNPPPMCGFVFHLSLQQSISPSLFNYCCLTINCTTVASTSVWV
jgi:hypothetical protein